MLKCTNFRILLNSCKHHADDAPPAYGSQSPTFDSPAPARTADSTPSREPQGVAATIKSSAASAANAIAPEDGNLRQQLKAAQAKIEELTAESGLRQRKGVTSGDKPGSTGTGGLTSLATQNQSAGGVPVQIVAALCLLSFLMAYFFF